MHAGTFDLSPELAVDGDGCGGCDHRTDLRYEGHGGEGPSADAREENKAGAASELAAAEERKVRQTDSPREERGRAVAVAQTADGTFFLVVAGRFFQVTRRISFRTVDLPSICQ